MIGYSYHPEAVEEIVEAVRYYDERAAGLGKELRVELDSAVLLLRQFPESAAPIQGSLRRQPLRRFPFALIYAVEESEIRIYAFSHRRRRPGYWLDRLPR